MPRISPLGRPVKMRRVKRLLRHTADQCDQLFINETFLHRKRTKHSSQKRNPDVYCGCK
jgi:hypothetical protein